MRWSERMPFVLALSAWALAPTAALAQAARPPAAPPRP